MNDNKNQEQRRKVLSESFAKPKEKKKRKKGWWIKPLIIIAVIAAILAGLFFGYVNDYYHADQPQLEALLSEGTTKPVENGGRYAFQPEETASVGFIFYPGGLVEESAYEPLMQQIADQGIACYLLKMPFHLAIFDMYAAQKVIDAHPEITQWYVGGHSLGGVAASTYAALHTDQVKGVVLLGAYSTKSLKTLRVLSVYGSEDGVLSRNQYESNRANLPENLKEVVLEGGNHSGFGCYGPQEKDGTATLSKKEQISQTAALIVEMMNS